jgi:hypothetical protein
MGRVNAYPISQRHAESGYTSPFGGAIFVDTGERRMHRIRSRAACKAALRKFASGPLVYP